mgnify:CR=1 FL=1
MPLSKARKARYNKRHYQESKLGILKPQTAEIQIPNDDSKVPVYDSRKLTAGDKVRIFNGRRWEVLTVPALDADDNPMWE